MSSAKRFGSAINVDSEEEGGGGGGGSLIAVGSGIQAECNPYFHFLDSNSDSGSVSMDAEPQFIDFFDRESYEVDTVREFSISSNQRVSTSGYFNIWEEDIELGLGIGSGSGSGSGSGDSGGVVVHREIDTGRVEVGTGFTPGEYNNLSEAMVLDEEIEWENLQNAIDWVQEPVQVSPSRDADWQFLWDASSFLEDMMDLDLGVYLANTYEDGEVDGEYDAVLAQMFDNQDGVMGSPPASKRVVDDLPAVVITSEQLSNGNTIVCAICKDDIVTEEKAKRLPCQHYYHGECIIPWLGIRNTCPVCRYELPTDDLEYERNRRSQRRGSSGLARESMSG